MCTSNSNIILLPVLTPTLIDRVSKASRLIMICTCHCANTLFLYEDTSIPLIVLILSKMVSPRVYKGLSHKTDQRNTLEMATGNGCGLMWAWQSLLL